MKPRALALLASLALLLVACGGGGGGGVVEEEAPVISPLAALGGSWLGHWMDLVVSERRSFELDIDGAGRITNMRSGGWSRGWTGTITEVGPQEFAVVVDYAHTPDSLRRVLEAAGEIAANRVIAVFGCGGDRDRGKRPMMGGIAVQAADVSFITSDNPRSEDPLAIIADIEEGARSAADAAPYKVIPDRREAIVAAMHEARGGDVVVIAGKGHEQGQIFADRVVPFDDVEEARSALKQRMGRI